MHIEQPVQNLQLALFRIGRLIQQNQLKIPYLLTS